MALQDVNGSFLAPLQNWPARAQDLNPIENAPEGGKGKAACAWQ